MGRGERNDRITVSLNGILFIEDENVWERISLRYLGRVKSIEELEIPLKEGTHRVTILRQKMNGEKVDRSPIVLNGVLDLSDVIIPRRICVPNRLIIIRRAKDEEVKNFNANKGEWS